MGFARFFGKSAISAASLLRRFDDVEFRNKLSTSLVAIAYDGEAEGSPEGQLTLELLVDLLARLYPRLAITALHLGIRTNSELRDRLLNRARQINPEIEFPREWNDAAATVVVGTSMVPPAIGTNRSVTYIGSSEWFVRASTRAPVGSGTSPNPYGAGAAACLGAASVFRAIFADELEQASPLSSALTAQDPQFDLNLSLVDFSVGLGIRTGDGDLLRPIDIGETFLVGVGAIGNAAVWALARTPGLQGTLHLIDGERIEESNLQRYVLSTQDSVGTNKVALAASEFRATATPESTSQLDVLAHSQHWDDYLVDRVDYVLDNVLLALDSAEDRIGVQSSLPRWIANAWTQPENLGVSRHPLFLKDACVACLYLPTQIRKSRDALYADALGLTGQDEIMEVRRLLHSGIPVGQPFLKRITDRLGVPFEPLAAYADRPLETFYTEALCGGVVLNLGGKVGSESRTEVPMAFQSAMAGILLASELVIHASALRDQPLPCRTEIDILRPLGTRLNSPASKHPSGRCICQDPAYRKTYRAKYKISADPKVRPAPST